ncbi:phage shock protein PspA [Neptunicella sp. SCSIO 80796]|uniref:phage shock protein PspA n=1 Tax=Neptunicella plasticusilytica TaxID=3117012 RepID=UPI003A4D75AB
MGMFTRISDIVQSNINAILDKAEDPQKVIRLIVQEMEETMVEVRSLAAKQLAEKKVLVRQRNRLEAKQTEWQQNAELALSKGREDLARSALAEKQAVLQKLAELDKQLDAVNENISQLQADSGRLAEKMVEVRAKQQSISIRQQSASVRLKAKVQTSTEQMAHSIERFEHYERRIDQLEAQVEAYELSDGQDSLVKEFNKLQQDEQLEAELAELKKKVA